MKKELRDTLRKELNSIFYEYFNYELEDIIKESFNESKSSRDKRQLARDLFKVTRDEMVRRGSLHFNFNPEIDLNHIQSKLCLQLLKQVASNILSSRGTN